MSGAQWSALRLSSSFREVFQVPGGPWELAHDRGYRYGSKGKSCERSIWEQAIRMEHARVHGHGAASVLIDTTSCYKKVVPYHLADAAIKHGLPLLRPRYLLSLHRGQRILQVGRVCSLFVVRGGRADYPCRWRFCHIAAKSASCWIRSTMSAPGSHRPGATMWSMVSRQVRLGEVDLPRMLLLMPRSASATVSRR